MERYVITVTIFCAVITRISCCDIVKLTFPSGFKIGTASAAYQVEGAWNISDKGENIWDHWTHNHPEYIRDGRNGDVACNSYYKYKEDVALIKSIGFDFYRFSVSWSRVLPTGFTNVISEDGLQYYKNLTAELVANGIEPVVTIYHWDHPQVIEEMGGWTNELIVDWFVAYARVLFEALGGSVKRWITMNEPNSFCTDGYEDTVNAPGKVITGIGKYLCAHNVLKAHAKTYRMYDEEFRDAQGGKLGIVLPIITYLPYNSSYTEAAEVAFQFVTGWLAHPLYFGDYPEIMKTRVALVSKSQGYPRSRLPEFSDEWIAIINGTNDYFGFNHYTSRLVYDDPDEELGIYNSDNGLIVTVDPSWPLGGSTWFYIYAAGFGELFRQIRDEYSNPPVWVMENGISDADGVDDYDRINYFYEYVREMLIAIKRDGCNVEGYAVWSIMDNFEWSAGYTERFGITYVEFDDADTNRTAKLSQTWWTKVLSKRKLQSVPTSTYTRTRLPWQK
ncbi:myrosinase 1-like [Neodiprion virginianus]|uniref:Cytosolic beta-glucosidase n=1 Tax=Neodiprion lecontei TaxID=441921 RepID=A0A6J0BHR6_NEOLC|nr:myrosinase 1 [Neodiprion lecontei]XP_046623557.1 myrosinase 1-like [Neodiprion virginianus]